MNLVTLQRRAPVAPGTADCRLCDAPIAGTLQDHLLVGQPGVAHHVTAICSRCGESVRRLVELYGPELSVLVQDHAPPPSRARAPRDPLEHTRQHLTQEAETLARTERTLRAEAEKLGSLRAPPGGPQAS